MCGDVTCDRNHTGIWTDRHRPIRTCIHCYPLSGAWKLRTSEALRKATHQCQEKSKIQELIFLSPKHIVSIYIRLPRPLAILIVQEYKISNAFLRFHKLIFHLCVARLWDFWSWSRNKEQILDRRAKA